MSLFVYIYLKLFLHNIPFIWRKGGGQRFEKKTINFRQRRIQNKAVEKNANPTSKSTIKERRLPLVHTQNI